MPVFTYSPQWEELREFYRKMGPMIPEDYTGLVAIRLHRTGFPLTLGLLGRELPEGALYPLVLLELERGELVRDWEWLEDHYDIPWAREDDFHHYRVDVMAVYHIEDVLEMAAEDLLAAETPDKELLARMMEDRAETPA